MNEIKQALQEPLGCIVGALMLIFFALFSISNVLGAILDLLREHLR